MLDAVTGAADPSNKLMRQAAWRSAPCNFRACPYFQAMTTAQAVHKTADSPTVYSAGSNCVLT